MENTDKKTDQEKVYCEHCSHLTRTPVTNPEGEQDTLYSCTGFGPDRMFDFWLKRIPATYAPDKKNKENNCEDFIKTTIIRPTSDNILEMSQNTGKE